MTEFDAMGDLMESLGYPEWAEKVRDRTVRMPPAVRCRLSADDFPDGDSRDPGPGIRADLTWPGGETMSGKLADRTVEGITLKIGSVTFFVPTGPMYPITPPPGSPASTPTLSP